MRRGPSVTLALVLVLGLGLVTSHPALASVSTKQVSVTRRGGDPYKASFYPSVSADGRYVAFRSEAGNLVPDDHTIRWPDIFVRDTVAGTTVRASVDIEGGDPDDASYNAAISADGQHVAFYSYASDLVPGDGNGFPDVFVRDLVAGTTVRASVDTEGGDPDGGSLFPFLSADGRYVSFHSDGSDLVPGDGNGLGDVFVRDLVAGTTVRASVDRRGEDPNGSSGGDSSISADGRYVAFRSFASNLVHRDRNPHADVFVRDLVAGTTVRASVDTEGGDPNNDSGDIGLSMSADGRYVAFQSDASNLVPQDRNVDSDIFVRDMLVQTTVRASVDQQGKEANGDSHYASISADGRYVAFRSDASDLVPGDRSSYLDIFVRDLATGTTVRVTVNAQGGDANASSTTPSISADGRHVAFQSDATNLLMHGRGDRQRDIFVATWL